MTQNIYDDPQFFEGYGRLPRSVAGLDGAPEWPALRALLPDLHGRKVLDLGCGYGWFCRWARENGAVDILGIDVSEKMLARAAATTQDKAIRYQRADMEQLELPAAAFDLVYSSLALHYVKDLERLMAQVHRSLAPGGSLVLHDTLGAGLVAGRCRPQNLAGRRLSRRGAAFDRLAGEGRHQAAPHRRDLSQHAAAARLRLGTYRGVGPKRGTDQRAPRSRR
jgi:SAM-dependent methyltransferase